ncbi:MAG: F0F1 ATP synthase subunit B [Flavobacteriia bacterium]|nr:F0F1 ATP synthase subunit B [Flavobacteriia bacterium]
MDLVTPSFGLLFWTGITFCLLLFVLAKFAWKPILTQVNQRSENIEKALLEAEKARQEMLNLQSENERVLKEARAERDAILHEAKEAASRTIEEAKDKAKVEGAKMIEAAQQTLRNERNAALAEMKSQIASFSVTIAEQVIRESLSAEGKQKALAEKMAEDIKLN